MKPEPLTKKIGDVLHNWWVWILLSIYIGFFLTWYLKPDKPNLAILRNFLKDGTISLLIRIFGIPILIQLIVMLKEEIEKLKFKILYGDWDDF